MPIRVERHELGPRCFVLGRRVHECHAGGFLLTAAAVAFALGVGPLLLLAAIPGAWMLIKDWRDLFPRSRDEASWRLGVHRRPRPLRHVRRAEWLAPLSGVLTALLGLVNITSTLTPDIGSREHLLRETLPERLPVLAHAFALPAGTALLIVGFYLARRRRRAWLAAVAVLGVAGLLNLLKGLDVEEASASWLLAGLLVWGRAAFWVQHEARDWRSDLKRAGLIATASLAAVVAAAFAQRWGTAPQPPGTLVDEVVSLLTFGSGSIRYAEWLEWLPAGVALVELGAVLAIACLLFKPLGAPGRVEAEAKELVHRIVRDHGRDTLSYFKLRSDQQYLFDCERRAFLGYRIEGGVLLVAGDPVGPPDALPSLVRELCAFAEARGLKLGVLGASERFASLARDAGLHSLYIGDEAIVELERFSLEGRAIRKVRQSVTRLERAGYAAELVAPGSLDAGGLQEYEAVSSRWLAGRRGRGFSMAMDSLHGEQCADTTLVVARDGAGSTRGFLHLVPVYGRPAASLSSMRRDPDTPNGLTEFLIVQAIEMLRERGVRELSLNFAAFARLLRSPRHYGERVVGKLLPLADTCFQVESLYRFNAKFQPRWQPRYLLYEGALGLPRTGLAAMWAEGQLPKPALRSSAAARAV
jgi:lysyl-tRNA synthetase class 2